MCLQFRQRKTNKKINNTTIGNRDLHRLSARVQLSFHWNRLQWSTEWVRTKMWTGKKHMHKLKLSDGLTQLMHRLPSEYGEMLKMFVRFTKPHVKQHSTGKCQDEERISKQTNRYLSSCWVKYKLRFERFFPSLLVQTYRQLSIFQHFEHISLVNLAAIEYIAVNGIQVANILCKYFLLWSTSRILCSSMFQVYNDSKKMFVI